MPHRLGRGTGASEQVSGDESWEGMKNTGIHKNVELAGCHEKYREASLPDKIGTSADKATMKFWGLNGG